MCVPGIYHTTCNGVNVSNSSLSSMQLVSTVSDTDTTSLSSKNELFSMQVGSIISTPLKTWKKYVSFFALALHNRSMNKAIH